MEQYTVTGMSCAQTFPFVAQFHALQGFQSAIHDRTPSHRQIPSSPITQQP